MREKINHSILQSLCRMLLLFCALTAIFFAAGGRAQAASSLKEPKIESVENKSTGVKLTWKEVSKASGYLIYRKKEDGSYKRIARINNNSKVTYKDQSVQSGKLYSYKICAFNQTAWENYKKAEKSYKKEKAGSDKKKANYYKTKANSYKAKALSSFSSAAKIRYLAPVQIKSATAHKNSIRLKWKSVSGASKYKIYRKSRDGSYKLLKTVSSSVTTYKDDEISPGMTYSYKMLATKGSFSGPAGEEISGMVSASIENVNAKYAIEADVSLTGSGSGYHAKLAIVAPDAAVSFGIQYDRGASYPYTGTAFFLVENIHSNASGGQAYWRVQNASLGTSYKLLLTLSTDGKCKIYIDGLYIDKVTNTEILSQGANLRVEGAAKVNGDYVNAKFDNIKLKMGTYQAKRSWEVYDMRNLTPATAVDVGIYSDLSQFAASRSVTISGTLKGLAYGQDWDSAYNSVSGVVQFG